jgi:hypothetical protein
MTQPGSQSHTHNGSEIKIRVFIVQTRVIKLIEFSMQDTTHITEYSKVPSFGSSAIFAQNPPLSVPFP